ncbi:hypothetical protein RB619_06560 [Flavobacterium sp. LHD-80]|uniref:hypothetical protein n=1 Tax=Flavobacterium sp. LHD-80 TaxID=3071411 RepID=UPI0027E068CA|nr:hypothetical protein [Flavobacterium sp. LHD-80]MDQ6470298.1 hypothetical protein [Flavobacterium sp. LHD-80]
MKKMICFLILTLGIVGCSSEESAPATESTDAKFYNKTGEDIDNLIIGKTFIGSLKNGSSTAFLDIKQFQPDGNQSYGVLSAISNTTKLTPSLFYGLPWNWCGTGRSDDYKDPNVFDIIKIKNDNGTTSLYLVIHY